MPTTQRRINPPIGTGQCILVVNTDQRVGGTLSVYQDGVFRRNPRNALRWSPKMVFVCTFLALVIGASAVMLWLYPNVDEVVKSFQENPFSLFKKPIGICLPNSTNVMQPIAEETIDRHSLKYFMYSGIYDIFQAFNVCHSHPNTIGTLPSVRISEHDQALTNFVLKYEKSFFNSSGELMHGFQKLLWTGGYVEFEVEEGIVIKWHDDQTNIDKWYSNFCEPKSEAWFTVQKLLEIWQRDRIGIPIAYILKDFKAGGCWRLLNNMLYGTEELRFHVVCQTSAARMPFKRLSLSRDDGTDYQDIFHGKLRMDLSGTKKRRANKYAIFTGRDSYMNAFERCRSLEGGTTMIAPSTVQEDFEINKLVEFHSQSIFGEDDGDPERRMLIWTGGYFNLTSKYPKHLRWNNDPKAYLDLPPPPEISTYAFQTFEKFQYENFCGPLSDYEKRVEEAVKDREAKATDCNKGNLMVLVKDYRPGQANQGCWHIYDLDYLIEHKYKFYVMCQLPGKAEETDFIIRETKEVFGDNKDSKDP